MGYFSAASNAQVDNTTCKETPRAECGKCWVLLSAEMFYLIHFCLPWLHSPTR
jgi:hypothetical protein